MCRREAQLLRQSKREESEQMGQLEKVAAGSAPETAAVIVAVYPLKDQADMALKHLDVMRKSGLIELIEAATVHKDFDGKIQVDDSADLGTGRGTRRGLVIGGVIGLIFPPSILVGAIGGSAVGALYGHFRDKGWSNAELTRAGDDLEAGQAGLIAVVVDKFLQQVRDGIDGYAKLDSYLLDADASATILAREQ